jgi:hypothetical protein
MKIEVASISSWPGFQFVVRAETDSDQAIIGQVANALLIEGKGRPWIHGVVYSPGNRGPVSFNFGWLEEKYFKEENVQEFLKLHAAPPQEEGPLLAKYKRAKKTHGKPHKTTKR